MNSDEIANSYAVCSIKKDLSSQLALAAHYHEMRHCALNVSFKYAIV